MLDVKFVSLHPQFVLPQFATPGSAGFDLQFWPVDMKEVVIEPGQRILLPLGFIVELPVGTELQIRPRSGMAFKQGITVLNSPGTIDSDYRGPVQALLINHGGSSVTITPGTRIAQAVVTQLPQVNLVLADEASDTSRGAGGFGSTGTN